MHNNKKIVTLLIVNKYTISKAALVGDTYIVPFSNLELFKKLCQGLLFKGVIFSGDYSAGVSWSSSIELSHFVRSHMIKGGQILVIS